MVLGTWAPHKPGQGPGTAPKPQPWGQDPLLPEGILPKPAAGAAAGKAAALLSPRLHYLKQPPEMYGS